LKTFQPACLVHSLCTSKSSKSSTSVFTLSINAQVLTELFMCTSKSYVRAAGLQGHGILYLPQVWAQMQKALKSRQQCSPH
jgi:hypothetical protein